MDEVSKTADYFLNAQLKALIPGKVFTSPGGALKREYEKDSIVGEVFSWVKRGTVVWWQLKEGGFVEHQPGKFDPKMATNTSQGKESEIKSFVNSSDMFSFLDSIPVLMSRITKLVVMAILIFIGWQFVWPFFKRFFHR